MSLPKISVIIPTYNRKNILRNAVESVVNQVFTDWELLIVDDGSTDGTKDAIEKYLSDKRIHYVYKQNGGASSARNEGLKRAKGKYITYIDSDDIVFPKYLEKGYEELERNPGKSFALIKAKRSLEFYDEDGQVQSVKEENFETKTPSLQDFYNWSVKASIGTGFFHRDSLKKHVQWNESLHLLETLDFVMQCGVADPTGFLFIPSELCDYRQRYGGDGACSNASYKDWSEAFKKIYDLHKNDPLMKNPTVFLSRVEKYSHLHCLDTEGKALPPKYKFFPEFYTPSKKLASV